MGPTKIYETNSTMSSHCKFFLPPGVRSSMQCSVRSSGESLSRGLVPKSDGRGGRAGGGGEGSAFKSKLEIKSSHSSHQRLLGSNSVSLQLFSFWFRFCNRESRWITFYSDRCTFAMEGDDTARKSIMMEQSCPHLSHITHL